MGTSQAEKAASHDRILDIASARIRRNGIDSLSVARLMNEAGLTHGGFYRHFDSREHLIAEASQRALSQGSAWTIAAGQLGGRRGYTKLVDGYLSAFHRDHPESGCGIAGIAADVGRSDSSARTTYSRQVKECLAVLADLINNPDPKAEEQEAVLTLSVLVGAITMARAVDDASLSQSILTNAAGALKVQIQIGRKTSGANSGLLTKWLELVQRHPIPASPVTAAASDRIGDLITEQA